AFEAHYGYDATYMKEMLRDNPEALSAFNAFLPMASFRKHAPVDVYYTAKVTAFQLADCGPCLQLSIRKAREDGVSRELLQHLLKEPERLSPLLAKVRAFTRAILCDEENHNGLRKELVEEIGNAAVIEIALGASSSHIFPVMKRALGHHQSCSLISLEI